ncbi:hypothetical protein DCO48_19390 [Pseudomonas sp. SDI]|uniref:fimbrial protein n=1 Tax=Pseudomonas sp. SDI TaxID=2170734 RepID=UPI000DE68A5E|nr:fimbrial protein [Pseudomonas sp. SDI]PWB30718.1 hypothetical protein DCO48_19390 [Pseudomonas sp. SDI]
MFNRLIAGMLFTLITGLLTTTPVSADIRNTCGWDPGSAAKIDLVLDLGAHYIPRDAKVGDVIAARKLYGKSDPISVIRCANNGDTVLNLDFRNDSPIVQNSFPGISGTVMETNIPGIGVQIEPASPYDGVAQYSWKSPTGSIIPFQAVIDFQLPADLAHNSIKAYVTLIKTGPIASGQPHQLDQTLGTASYTGVPDGLSVGVMGTVTQAECNVTQNPVTPIEVNLGDWKASDFTQQGYTTTAKDFSIALNSCVADASGNPVANAYIQLDPTAGSTGWDDDQGVFTSSVAGIGIQLLDANDRVVPLKKEVEHMPVSAGNIDLKFKARYYQTDTTVGAGKAEGALSFTIFYK